MKKRTLRLAATALALASALTGCAAADTSTAAQIEMRVQDGYIQYYNGTDWENLISTEELKGEKGDKGDKGDPGEKGERGETGPQGAKGDKGDPGTNGINGQNGADGANGKDGTNGQNGTNGKNGVDGKNGTDGKDGADGKDGLNGKDGIDGKDGRDGVDGKDGLNGKDGRDGVDGKDGKDGIDGKDGRDGVDGKDGISSVPGITRSISIGAYNYYSGASTTLESGYLTLIDKQNIVLNDGTTAFDEKDAYRSISLLMNEDGTMTVSAVPGDGWTFLRWSDGSTDATRKITYADKSSLDAYFCPVKPVLSWDKLKMDDWKAQVGHSYSETEPWIDINYTDPYHSLFASWVHVLGDGIVIDSGKDSESTIYVDVRHSTNTVVRYSNLIDYSASGSSDESVFSYHSCDVHPLLKNGVATLRIQIMQDSNPVDPETVLPPLSTVDWLEQGA